MIEDCINIAQYWSEETSGLLFGARRREAMIYQARCKQNDG